MAHGKTIFPDQIFQPKVRTMEVVVVFEDNIDTIRFGLGVARLFLRPPWIHQDALFPVLMKIEFIEDKYQITIR
jgi:ethanolamine ammonia-lyase large subunit